LVYPKLEAAKITGDTGEAVLAVDPESDKLPANLPPDDMKVVTLWLLSPERVEAGHHGVGLKAAKSILAGIAGNLVLGFLAVGAGGAVEEESGMTWTVSAARSARVIVAPQAALPKVVSLVEVPVPRASEQRESPEALELKRLEIRNRRLEAPVSVLRARSEEHSQK
jgi:hypothetical protein